MREDVDVAPQLGLVGRALLADLRARGQDGSALGRTALALASHVDFGVETQAVTAAARELRLVLTEIMKIPSEARSGIDDLRARRAEREKAAAR